MKTRFSQISKGILLLYFLLHLLSVKAQERFVPTNTASINYTITNVVQVNDRILEFDLYLKNNDSIHPFELSIIQAGILVNSAIINGGNVTSLVVPGFSELVSSQQPTKTIFVKGPSTSTIKVAAKIGPGGGNGTIIKTNGQGTRICRLRITNSVPFAKERANLTFCFTIVPYPTRVFQYIGRISTLVTVNSSNCFNIAANPVLNE